MSTEYSRQPKHDGYIHVACVSDIHLESKRTPTDLIIRNLNTYLTNDRVFKDLDVLFLAGDVFDNNIALSRPHCTSVMSWMQHLILLSIKHKVCVRVLEGTPSHDRAQSRHFITKRDDIYHAVGVRADIEYFDTLSVEALVFTNRTLQVLYVPDEWGPAQSTLEQVDELMHSRGLNRFDLAVMHGTFDFQNPIIAHHAGTHKSEEYSKRAKLIFIGHEHTARTQGNIIAQGSFDRLEHGQEQPKGYIRVKILEDDSYIAQRVVNKTAAVFKTIICKSDDVEAMYEDVHATARSLEDGSHVCIETFKSSAMAQSLTYFERNYPQHVWKLSLKDSKASKEILADATLTQIPSSIVLNEHTLLGLCEQQAKFKCVADGDIAGVLDIIKQVMQTSK